MDAAKLQLLYNNWVHSHEDDADDMMVFRPASYNFPPSRGRVSLNLKPNGIVNFEAPAPDDRKAIKDANWKLNKNFLILNDQNAIPSKLKLVSLNKDKLIVKKITK